MKNSLRMLTLILVLLVFLGGAYILLLNYEPNINDDRKAGQEENSDMVFLTDISTEDIVSAEFSLKNNKFVILNDSGRLSVSGYESALIDREDLRRLLTLCSRVDAQKINAHQNAYKEYGITDKSMYILIRLADGQAKKIVFGSSTNIDGQYYAMEEVSGQMGAISGSTYEALTKRIEDYRSLDVCQADMESIRKISLKKGDELIFDISAGKGKNGLAKYVMTAPFDANASTDSLYALFEEFGEIKADRICEENPVSLLPYGLDNPYILMWTDSQGSHTLRLGSRGESGIYMMYNNIPAVYEAKCNFYETIKKARTEDYLEAFVHIYEMDKVSKVTVTGDTRKLTLDIQNQKANGKKISAGKLKELYRSVIGITFADIAQAPSHGRLLYTVEFSFADKTAKAFEYFDCGRGMCCVTAENGICFVTYTKNLEAILEN